MTFFKPTFRNKIGHEHNDKTSKLFTQKHPLTTPRVREATQTSFTAFASVLSVVEQICFDTSFTSCISLDSHDYIRYYYRLY